MIPAVPAPAGWGYRPGADMTQPKPVRLPDLPLLRCVRSGFVAPVLVTALNADPDLVAQVTTRMLIDKYGIPRNTANRVIYTLGPGDTHG